MPDFLLSFLFVLYGFAKACTDIKRDRPDTNIIYFTRWKWPYIWYIGGNKRFNPSLLGDFWHFFDKLKLFCFVGGVLIAPHTSISLYYHVLPNVYFSMLTFTIFYHAVFPLPPDGTVWQQVLRVTLFWRNFHK